MRENAVENGINGKNNINVITAKLKYRELNKRLRPDGKPGDINCATAVA